MTKESSPISLDDNIILAHCPYWVKRVAHWLPGTVSKVSFLHDTESETNYYFRMWEKNNLRHAIVTKRKQTITVATIDPSKMRTIHLTNLTKKDLI